MDEILPQVGDIYRCFYGKGNRNNKLIHIRAVVDGEYVVYRYWWQVRWNYRLVDPTFFEVGLASGHITRVED